MNKLRVIILLIILLCLSLQPKQIIHAVEPEPSLVVTSSEGYIGSSVYIGVQINHALQLSALSFDVYFNENYLRIYSSSANSSIASTTITNHDQLGIFSFSMAQSDPIQTEGTLVNLWFSILPDAPLGDIPLTLVIGEAFDDQLNPMIIKGTHGNVKVLEATQSFETITIYHGYDMRPQHEGDIIQIDYSAYQLKNLAAGNFEFFYDPLKLIYLDYEMGGSYRDPSVLHQMNDAIPGYLNLSFAWHQGAYSSYPVMKIRFRVIANVTGTTDVIMKPSNLYSAELNPLLCQDVISTIQLIESIPSENHPDLTLTSYKGSNKSSFDIELSIEYGSMLAAGDFTITYDSTKIKATSISIEDSLIDLGVYLIYHETIDQGLIRFSFIYEEGLVNSSILMTITFEPVNASTNTIGQIMIQGSGTVNNAFDPVNFDYVSAQYELLKAYSIIFEDSDGSIIDTFILYENETIVAPDAPSKLGYKFIGWDQTFDKATQDLVIRAVYEIDHSTQFVSKTVIYNGQSHSLELLNLPEGSLVSYSGPLTYTIPGAYTVDATISKEGFEDLILQASLIIEKAPITIQADNKTSPYGSNLLELTYTLIGTIYDDISVTLQKEEGLSAGDYMIHVTADHPYYEITLIDGHYLIVGQNIDTSNLSFSTKNFIYDGNIKRIELDGELPFGIISVSYTNHEATDAGTYYVIAHFVVQEGFNPIENMVTEWTIEKAFIEGITMSDMSYTYDGLSHGLSVNTLESSYGDQLNVIYSPVQSAIYAGIYTITATLSHPNYHPLELTATLSIAQASLTISEEDISLNIHDTYIDISYENMDLPMYYSIDGIDYSVGTRIDQLEDYHDYEISVYIGETKNFLPSNILTFNVKTYRSYDRIRDMLTRNQSTINADTYQDLIYLYEEIEHTNPSYHDELNLELLQLIDDYNAYISVINDEFTDIIDYNHYLYPVLALSLNIMMIVVIRRKGRDM